MTWRNESAAWYNENIVSKTWSVGPVISYDTVETSSSTTIYPDNVSTYKLCDGTPRANVRPITHHFSGNSTTSWTVTLPQTPTFSAQPCTPDPEMCRIWYYDSNIQQNDEHELIRQCGLPAHQGAPCLIGGGPVQLVYFPVTAVDGNLCVHNGSTLPPPPLTGDPPVVTTLGHTFTSGSVYISFKSLFASYDGFWDRIGPTFSDFILPLPSSAVSTQCGGWGNAHGPGTALNYADLNWPVPASAYSCQDRCSVTWTSDCPTCTWYHAPNPPECNTIWSDVDPVLAVPTQARDLVPEWSTCSFWDLVIPNFWFDPPIALQQSPAAATPTMPTTEVASTAVPKSSVKDGLPTNTAASQDPQPTLPNQPSSADPGADSALPSVTSAQTNPGDPGGSPTQTRHSEGSNPESHMSMPALSILAGALSSMVPVPDPGVNSMLSKAHSVAESIRSHADPSHNDPKQPVHFSAVPTTSREGKDDRVTVLSAGSFTVTASALGSKSVVVGDTTLWPGGPVATMSGHVVSKGSSGLVWLSLKASSTTQGSLPPVVTNSRGLPSITVQQTRSNADSGPSRSSATPSGNASSRQRVCLWLLTCLALVSILYMI